MACVFPRFFSTYCVRTLRFVRLVRLLGCPGIDADADHADGEQAGKGEAQAAWPGAVWPKGTVVAAAAAVVVVVVALNFPGGFCHQD